jgi:Calcineurin-like phosphoesterase
MNILFLHLSDIHIVSDKVKNVILTHTEAISSAVRSSLPKPQACFILVTGDIAFSGKQPEYEIATEFFRDLASKFSDWLEMDPIFVMAPGNHDCDFSLDSKTRQVLLEHLDSSSLDDTIVENCTSVQRSYFDFSHAWSLNDCDTLFDNKLLIIQRFNFSDYILCFYLLNSAWMSRRHEIPGKLSYPVSLMEEANSPVPPHLVVTMFHHPYNWFNPTTARSLRSSIDSISDIILTGHEHVSLQYSKIYSDQGNVEYIEGGVLQESGSPDSSTFNAISVDLELKEYTAFEFKLDGKCMYMPQKLGTKQFLRNKQRLQSDFTLNSSFAKTLHDPGATYSHPYKDPLLLEDFFIYPSLRELQIIGQRKKSHGIISGTKIFSFVLKHQKTLILGKDKSGKSALARYLFIDFQKNGRIPVLIHGESFKSPDEQRIRNVIGSIFSEEYCESLLERFLQTDPSRKVVIIDDYHRIPLNRKGKERILNQLTRDFGTIILTGSDEVCWEELISSEPDMRLLFEFKHCEIMEFGRLLRSELIKKWYSLGNQYTKDEVEQETAVIQAENTIDTLLGRNFLPAYPSFVLMLLQQLEAKIPVKTTPGSYGYLYEALITASLSKVSNKAADIDAKYNYLTEFAFYLFDNKELYVSNNDMREWHKIYCGKYKKDINYEIMKDDLEKCGIFFKREGMIGFNYKYIYYFFVARYFRDHIGEELIRRRVEEMSRKLSHEETANVVIFLAYSSKDPVILNTMLEAARELFRDHKKCELYEDTKFLNEWMVRTSEWILSNTDATENRRKRLALQDKAESMIEKNEEGKEYNNERKASNENIEDKQMNDMMKINAAFKTIQIVGQILRNFEGSIAGEV